MKSFICSECGVQFASKATANRHFKSSHANKLGFACPYPNCAYKGSRADTVKRHMYRHSAPNQPSPRVVPTSGTALISSSSQLTPPQTLIHVEQNLASQAPKGTTYNLIAASTLQDGSTLYHTEEVVPNCDTATSTSHEPTPSPATQKTAFLYAGQSPDNYVQPAQTPPSATSVTMDTSVKQEIDPTFSKDTDMAKPAQIQPKFVPSTLPHSNKQDVTPHNSKDYYSPDIIPISDTDEDSEDEEDIDGVFQINSTTTSTLKNEAHINNSQKEENSDGKFISGTMAMAFNFKVFPTAGDWFRMNDKNELVKKELLPGQVLQVDINKNLKLLQLLDI